MTTLLFVLGLIAAGAIAAGVVAALEIITHRRDE